MNEPIINPWMIYLIESLDFLIFALVFFGIITVIISIIASGFILDDSEIKPSNKYKQIKVYLITFIFAFIMFIFGILIPSTSTGYKMLIASKLTPNNYKTLKEEGIEIKDLFKEDIEEIIESWNNHNKEEDDNA